MPRKRVEIDWAESAEAHLEAIRAYIARDSTVKADRFIRRIQKAVEGLGRMPHMGEILAISEAGVLREIYVGNYRVVFRIIDKNVRVLAVLHGARNFIDFDTFSE